MAEKEPHELIAKELSPAQARVLLSMRSAAYRGFVLFGIRKNTYGALKRRGLVKAHELTGLGWLVAKLLAAENKHGE